MENVIIYGSQLFASYVKELAITCGHNVAGFIDDFHTGEHIIGTFDEVKKTFRSEEYKIVIAIGYNNLNARWDVYQKVIRSGYEVLSLVHPNAFVHESVKLGAGTIICTGSIIDLNTQIGELTFIWPGSIINHDCVVGNNNFLSPRTTMCGFSKVGDHCFIGAGTTIIDSNDVGNNAFIKAGTIFYRRGIKS
ncbi:hypothetical protein M3661_00060 [Paenibacillus sp. MER 180]|uniref:PglD-related sugar-binding protein n=1 Tax=Paenibacillus sp. MER 180 TaxID=2939570 RepID=UPI002041EF36|nr:DapH/DapD/GlmU-related protein [Paenibacillus sp. MER 180]MCM3288522.1 hypothetical protein [Paenibacillus sp. MER 180]